ncbi:MAG: hypothetical protein QOE76_1333, partial [Frankiales bacterium]|nr:hypothetical protein [Frankiales bacterium]
GIATDADRTDGRQAWPVGGRKPDQHRRHTNTRHLPVVRAPPAIGAKLCQGHPCRTGPVPAALHLTGTANPVSGTAPGAGDAACLPSPVQVGIDTGVPARPRCRSRPAATTGRCLFRCCPPRRQHLRTGPGESPATCRAESRYRFLGPSHGKHRPLLRFAGLSLRGQRARDLGRELDRLDNKRPGLGRPGATAATGQQHPRHGTEQRGDLPALLTCPHVLTPRPRGRERLETAVPALGSQPASVAGCCP